MPPLRDRHPSRRDNAGTISRTLATLLLVGGAPALAETKIDWQAVGQIAGTAAGDTGPGRDTVAGFAGWAVQGSAERTTPSGLTYGIVVTAGSGDYERSVEPKQGLIRPGNNEKLTLNEAYLYLISGWGRVRLGDEDGAAKRAVDLLPILAGGQLDGFWPGAIPVDRPADHLGRDSDDATKILYETPRLMGARLGISYAPERDSLVEDLDAASDLANEDGFLEIGLNYRGDFRRWQYEIGAGYGRGPADRPGLADTETFKVAGLVLYGGFSLGGVWFDDGDSARPIDADLDTQGWTLQGTYENGPYGLTLFGHRSETEPLLQYNAYGLGLSWNAWQRRGGRGSATVGLDVVRFDADRTAGALGPAETARGVLGQLLVEVRF